MTASVKTFDGLSVVIPAYNAAGVIRDTVRDVDAFLSAADVDHELIVVDDGSDDGTSAALRGCDARLFRNERNRGKGCAVRRGVLAADGRWVLYMDADHSTSIEHLTRFASHAHDSDVIIASRRLPQSRIVRRQPRLRQALGRTFPYLVRLCVLRDIQDTQCGFKLFRRGVGRAIFERQRCAGFCFDVEVLLIARRLGCRVAEVPADWDNPSRSTVRLGADPPRMLWDLVRIVWRHRRSRYSHDNAAPPISD